MNWQEKIYENLTEEYVEEGLGDFVKKIGGLGREVRDWATGRTKRRQAASAEAHKTKMAGIDTENAALRKKNAERKAYEASPEGIRAAKSAAFKETQRQQAVKDADDAESNEKRPKTEKIYGGPRRVVK